MNKKIIITIVSIIIIIALVYVFTGKSGKEMMQETPVEALDKTTQDDTIDAMESDLNSIDITASSSEDFEATDMEIKSL